MIKRAEVQAPTWDLEILSAGGPRGAAFAGLRDRTAAALRALQTTAEGLPALDADPASWAKVFLGREALDRPLTQIGAYAVCAAAAHSRDPACRAAEADADALYLLGTQLEVLLGAVIDGASDAVFEAFVARPELADQVPSLRTLSKRRSLRLPPALQALKVAMDRESLTGWGRLYDHLMGSLTADVDIGGQVERLGIGHVAAMRADPDPVRRKAAFDASHQAWQGVSEVCAHTLTQITGARQQHIDRLGVDELTETLLNSRIDPPTLEAMWAAAEAARADLQRYHAHKAKLLGTKGLAYWDIDAPIPMVGSDEVAAPLSWAEVKKHIVAAFGGFHPELADFANEAFDGRWIDALPRDDRRPGGFCADFPLSDQSRIFLTFTGTLENGITLAHELGHAFHNRVMWEVPTCRRETTRATAETASTFAEALFRDYLLRTAPDRQAKAVLLDQQLQAATGFLMDIPHRFAFERQLYALRREGPFQAARLSEAVVACQRLAFGDHLAAYNPSFWCSKLHFYIPETGFYNWPYTFGYLFSAAVHRRALAEGPSFYGPLRELLVRTGWQDTVPLAAEVLGADLHDPAFWVDAVAPIRGWVDDFIASTS